MLRTSAVGVGTSVSHGEDANVVLNLEVFIVEFAAPNALATGAIEVGEVTTLDHEVGNNTVEDRAFITIARGARTEAFKVFDCLGYSFAVQAHDNATSRLSSNF